MSNSLEDSFPTPAGACLKLTVFHLGSGTNQTERVHWTKRYQEQRQAFLALRSALRCSAADHSIPTMLRDLSKTCSMALDMHILFTGTKRGASGLSTSKLKSIMKEKNGQK